MLARLPEERHAEAVARLSPNTRAAIVKGAWSVTARPEQRPPSDGWRSCLFLGGRGAGKTRSGAEWILDEFERGTVYAGLVGRTVADVRSPMIRGESGLAVCAERRGIDCVHVESTRTVTLTRGDRRMVCATYSAEEPDQAAGPQHEAVWGDEFAGWAPIMDKAGRTMLDNLLFGLRLGKQPRMFLTTTPRPKQQLRDLLNPESKLASGGVAVITSTMYDNRANLPAVFIEAIEKNYAGTRLGDQEILGRLIDAQGVYFQRAWFNERWLDPGQQLTEFLATGGWHRVRFWDLTHAAESDSNPDPDWTVGSRVALDAGSMRFVWEDCRMIRATPGGTEKFVRDTAISDGPGVVQIIEQTPGAGAAIVAHYRDHVIGPTGAICRGEPVRGTKTDRAQLPSARAEAGRMWIVRGDWNTAALDQCEEFPDGPHDDIVDSLSGAVRYLDGLQVAESMGAGVAQVKIPSPIRN